MPFLNLKEVEVEVDLCLIQDTIETVQNNMESFTKHELKEEKAARETQEMLGQPMDCKFLGMANTFKHDIRGSAIKIVQKKICSKCHF